MNRLQEMWTKFGDELGTPRGKDDHVLIIDGLNTFIRVFSAVPALNDDGMHVGGVIGFLKSVGANIRQFQATRCVVVFDGTGGSQRRRKLYPDYKSNRKNKTKMNRFDEFADLVDEQASMKAQFRRIVDYFDTLPITVISIDNIEADDVIAYITKQYYETADNKITIVSTDRDFIQLVNERTKVWSPVKKKLYTEEKIQEEFGILPKNYLLYRMLSGDASDNINGVAGIGLPTLLKRFPSLVSEPCTVDQLLENASKQIAEGTRVKIYNALCENRDLIERNYKLMQLNDVDIAATNKLRIGELMDSPVNKMNTKTFKRLFLEDKLYANIKDVDSWLRDTFKRLDIYAGAKIS
jgi:5'-3' exonuclease